MPLWFGNQFAPDDDNPTYGTSRVLLALADLGLLAGDSARRGIAWLRQTQNADGSWGGAAGVPGSVEETSLAVDALLAAHAEPDAVEPRLWPVDPGRSRPAGSISRSRSASISRSCGTMNGFIR